MIPKVIVYGLGQAYSEQKYFIEHEFEIVAYTDRRWEIYLNTLPHVINPTKIGEKTENIEYNYIYITSRLYFEEIRNTLCRKGVPLSCILSVQDMWWDVKNATNRDEWVIAQLSSLEKGSIILDAGAGNRRYKKYCTHLNYISQDFGKYDDTKKDHAIHGTIKWESRKCDIISDITQIPLDDKSVDVILCTEVLEHVPDPLAVLEEFSRLIKPKGILLLTTPFCSLTHMAPFYFHNGFSRYWLEESLRKYSFRLKTISTNGNWFFYLAQELQRLPYMMKQYGKEMTKGEAELMISATSLMMEQGKIDSGSDELLCFGYCVRAVKAG